MFGEHFGGKAIFWSSAAIFLGLAAAWWQECRRKKLQLNAIPSKWRLVGEVDELLIYPLKSGRAIQVKQAECTEVGLRMINDNMIKLGDRVFVVYNEENGCYKTCGQEPKMVLIDVSVNPDGKVVFEGPGMATKLEISIPDSSSKTTFCSMWFDEKVSVVDCGEEAGIWFSEFVLGQKSGLKLGYHHIDSALKRNMEQLPWSKFKKYYKNIRNEDYGVFSDLASFMMLGANSVAELNTRLSVPVTAKRFRPNFVIRGSSPYEEDTWDWIKVGDSAVFRRVKPCTRCMITAIDPETGVVDLKTKEPLNTLKKYRKLTDPAAVKLEGDSPVMGQYLGLHVTGVAKVGDPVYVGAS